MSVFTQQPWRVRPQAPWRADRPLSGRARELVAIGLILLVVLPVAAVAVHLRPEGSFYQNEFTPGAMLACGHGFVDVPPKDRPPALQRFVGFQGRSIDCAALRGLPTQPPDDLQVSMRWLITSAAAVWWITGHPSWDVLLPLNLLLIGLSAIAAYGLLRLFARRTIAAPLAVLAVLWPYHLFMLPELRDYSKTPFIWFACLGIAVGVLGGSYRRRVLGATLAGLAVGIGFGFRADLLTLVPVGAVALLLQPWQGVRRLWRTAVIVGAFLACFAISASPILPSYEDNSNNGGIIAVEGLSPEIQGQTGMRSDLYMTTYHYNDIYTAGLAAAYGRFVEHKPGPYYYSQAQLDTAANATYTSQIRFLPADMILRVVMSSIASLRLGTVPPFSSLFVGLPILFAALVLLGARRPRALAVALVLGLPLIGVTALQWHVRHAFQIALVAFLVVAAAIEIGLRVRAQRRGEPDAPRFAMPSRAALRNTAAVLLAGVAVLGIVYMVERGRQDTRVTAYIAQLGRQPRAPVPARAIVSGSRTTIPLSQRFENTWEGIPFNRSALLRISVGNCAARHASLTLRYAAPTKYLDFTQTERIDPRGGASWYVVAPVVSGTRPSAIELAGAPGCALHAERVLPRDLPILLNVLLDGSTRHGPKHAVADLPSWTTTYSD